MSDLLENIFDLLENIFWGIFIVAFVSVVLFVIGLLENYPPNTYFRYYCRHFNDNSDVNKSLHTLFEN